MLNFLRIAIGIDVLPLMHALQRKPTLWGANPFRTAAKCSPHAEVDDVLLRFEVDEQRALDEETPGELGWCEAWRELPEVKPILMPLLMRVGAYEVGRVMITKLRPGCAIDAHADTRGAYARIPDMARYHVALQGLPGSLFHVERETVMMASGEAWLINNRAVHSVRNESADDRVHLLVDARIAP